MYRVSLVMIADKILDDDESLAGVFSTFNLNNMHSVSAR